MNQPKGHGSLTAALILAAALGSCGSEPPAPEAERDAGRLKQVLARAITLAKNPAAPPEDVLRLFQEAVLVADGTPAAPEVARAFDAYCAESMASLADTLLLRWTFDDEGPEVTDASRCGRHGVLSREGAVLGKGAFGKGLILDGTGFVHCGRTAGLEPKAVTVSLWMRRSGPQAAGGSAVFRKAWGIRINPAGKGGDVLAFHTGHEGGPHELLSPANAVPDGEWVHVAGVYDPAGRKRLYVNGALVASAEFTKPILYDAASMDDVLAGPCTGALDEVRVYGRALSGAQVKILSRR